MFKKIKPSYKRLLLDITGWFCIVFGVLGLFLPLLQGVLFLAVGSYLLSLHSPWFHTKLVKLKGRYPAIAGPLERLDHFVRAQFGLETHP